MNLVIVESPAKAKTINKYLGSNYKVISSFGHIRDLPSKNGSVKPEEDFVMNYEVSDKSKKHVQEIVKLAKNVDSVYLATDPDREGEAIAWHIVEVLKEKKALKKSAKVCRIVFHEITKKAVLDGVSKPRDLDMDLINAQQARRALDYLVGFTISPILWRKLPGSKSAGRVQSVALRLICDREDEINQFVKQEYWTIRGEFLSVRSDQFIAKLISYEGKKLEKFSIKDSAQANEIVDKLKKLSYKINKIEKKTQKRNPYAPFITSSLQQEASRKLGFSAKKTMQIAQKLYEGVEIGGELTGLITYMRTDGTQLSDDAVNSIREMISQNYGNNYLPKSAKLYKTKAKNAQEAHEAIRPTNIMLKPDQAEKFLDKDQARLYDLIWKRTIACQMESAEIDVVSAFIDANDNSAQFKANGYTLRFDGFLKVYNEDIDDKNNDDDDESSALPILNENETSELSKLIPNQHFTEPPPRYSEASLVKKLEELSIGRPSTYAAIISVLQEREYVQLDKKRFIPEERGRIVTAFLKVFFAQYVEYGFTANLEDKLDYVSDGKLPWKELMREFWKDFDIESKKAMEIPNSSVTESILPLIEHHIFGKDNSRKCPSCDTGKLDLKIGKYGPFISCSNYPTCEYRSNISNEDNKMIDQGEDGGARKPEDNEKQIGYSESLQANIYIKKGPYGLYLQAGEGTKNVKRSTIPGFISAENINLDLANKLLSMPCSIGNHPQTSEPVHVGIGKFGPYILYQGKYTSIKNPELLLTLTIDQAVEILSGAKQKSADKIIGKLEDADVIVAVGRYGPYIKWKNKNFKIPKGVNHEEITLDQAKQIVQI